MNISDRLREERVRLGLSQIEFGEIGGVKKLAQINYEKGERNPDSAYLAAIATAGADVLYVLTGQRQEALPAADPSEQLLLENYRRCKLDAKQTLLKSAVLFAAGMGEQPSTPSGGTIKASVKKSLFGMAIGQTGKK